MGGIIGDAPKYKRCKRIGRKANSFRDYLKKNLLQKQENG